MVFSSEEFLFIFLPIVILGYYFLYFLFRNRIWGLYVRNIWLLAGSLIFYAWGEPKYVWLMIGDIAFNYLMALIIGKIADKSAGDMSSASVSRVETGTVSGLGKRLGKVLMILTVIVNLLILGWFKYAGFIYSEIDRLTGHEIFPPKLKYTFSEIVLPIGISFYTFQALSYVVDVYKGRVKADKNPLNVGLYISFFPQLIAGPIVRFDTIAERIRDRKESFAGFSKGAERFMRGLIKKVLIANRMASVADNVWGLIIDGRLEASVPLAWLGAISYSLQILFDFSGYSDMAIGLVQMFGFKLPENFDHPYTAESATQFWRKWHMTLSGWFKDYVYIPLGGSRAGRGRTIFNLFIVWLLTGIWHGANYTFIVWGMLYFVVLTAEKLVAGRVAGASGENAEKVQSIQVQDDKRDRRGAKGRLTAAVKHIYTLLVVCIAWVIFRSDSINDAWIYIKGMFGGAAGGANMGATLAYLKQNAVFYIAAIVLCMPVRKWFFTRLKGRSFDIVYGIVMAAGALLAVSYIFNNAYSPFIYYNF
ncbi:MAG: MBOAT family protein [Lachnospiraceae bacterium]|nr:MBOAT family protein [Lachnospiraceae bacterium]